MASEQCTFHLLADPAARSLTVQASPSILLPDVSFRPRWPGPDVHIHRRAESWPPAGEQICWRVAIFRLGLIPRRRPGIALFAGILRAEDDEILDELLNCIENSFPTENPVRGPSLLESKPERNTWTDSVNHWDLHPSREIQDPSTGHRALMHQGLNAACMPAKPPMPEISSMPSLAHRCYC